MGDVDVEFATDKEALRDIIRRMKAWAARLPENSEVAPGFEALARDWTPIADRMPDLHPRSRLLQ